VRGFYKLIGFRNSLSWGTWKDAPAWAIPAGDSQLLHIAQLLQGRCPVDGTPVRWGEVRAANILVGPWWGDLGGGYWVWTGLARDDPGEFTLSRVHVVARAELVAGLG